jgi:hypothetical protein
MSLCSVIPTIPNIQKVRNAVGKSTVTRPIDIITSKDKSATIEIEVDKGVINLIEFYLNIKSDAIEKTQIIIKNNSITEPKLSTELQTKINDTESSGAVNAHNTSETAHTDIRSLFTNYYLKNETRPIFTGNNFDFTILQPDGIYYDSAVGIIVDVKTLFFGIRTFIYLEKTDIVHAKRYSRFGSKMFTSYSWESEFEKISDVQPKATNATKTATSTGTQGQQAYDNDYFYVCTDTDTWIRFAKSAWE